mgnify:FL=1
MNKKLWLIAVIVVTAFCMFKLYSLTEEETNIDKESRGIFDSYIECTKYLNNKDSKKIKSEISNIIDNISKLHFNRVYLQVRPFSDSIYKSSIFPSSYTVVENQGDELTVDILDYFIKTAKAKNIEIYAWINPYRISNDTDITKISVNNPAYKWLDTNNVKIIKDRGIFYNPSSQEVINLIVDGVKEIVTNYQVDGIIMDDYFYPDDSIDLVDYKEVENSISLTDYRLSKVNELISSIYKNIKNINPKIQFGISPDGNINNNYEIHYADVKKWLKDDGYIDFIMPQLYYGFNNEAKPYIKTLNEWNSLIKNNTKLIVALSLYKSGSIDNYAKNGKYEWIENDNIIKKQIQVARNLTNCIGYSIFRYDYFFDFADNLNLQGEINNYKNLFEF